MAGAYCVCRLDQRSVYCRAHTDIFSVRISVIKIALVLIELRETDLEHPVFESPTESEPESEDSELCQECEDIVEKPDDLPSDVSRFTKRLFMSELSRVMLVALAVAYTVLPMVQPIFEHGL